MKKPDFQGWATKANIRCSDGKTIMKNAFAHQDGAQVPLVYQHDHMDPKNVLGHAVLENRDEGVWAYCYLNDSENAQAVREQVKHGDIKSFSIWANQLTKNANDIVHGTIRELSVVLAGANPGALIDNIVSHGVELDDEAIIYTGEEIDKSNSISHDDSQANTEVNKKNQNGDDTVMAEQKETKEKTLQEIVDSMTEEQKNALYFLVGKAAEGEDVDDDENGEGAAVEHSAFDEGDDEMKNNVFDTTQQNEDVLSHSQINEIVKDAKRYGTLRDAFESYKDELEIDDEILAHSIQDDAGATINYGIANIGYLFPDAQAVNGQYPAIYNQNSDWVAKVMHGVKHIPFSRVKSLFADITGEDARARGYVKGKLKKEEVIKLLKRVTTPTTIYKKQKLDRDDVIDIVDIDIVKWLKSEMRIKLDEEIARAVLIGDGRSSVSEDKINELNVRPIYTDDDFYSIKHQIAVEDMATGADKAKMFIDGAIRARKAYKGSGKPTAFMTEDLLTECLLLEDKIGRKLYEDETKLATALRVKEIVTVPFMDGLTREASVEEHPGVSLECGGIIVNLTDYVVGADKGGSINLFEDFDIDYNQQKYLIETRCSGALVVPFSAIVIEFYKKSAVVAG